MSVVPDSLALALTTVGLTVSRITVKVAAGGGHTGRIRRIGHPDPHLVAIQSVGDRTHPQCAAGCTINIGAVIRPLERERGGAVHADCEVRRATFVDRGVCRRSEDGGSNIRPLEHRGDAQVGDMRLLPRAAGCGGNVEQTGSGSPTGMKTLV